MSASQTGFLVSGLVWCLMAGFFSEGDIVNFSIEQRATVSYCSSGELCLENKIMYEELWGDALLRDTKSYGYLWMNKFV